MYTLLVKNGDLALDFNGTPLKAEGVTKLKQEMTHILVTELGSNHFHTSYGSNLENYIGLPCNEETLFEMESATREALRRLQIQQAELVKRSRVGLSKANFRPEEFLEQVHSVKTRQRADIVELTVKFSTYNSTSFESLSIVMGE